MGGNKVKQPVNGKVAAVIFGMGLVIVALGAAIGPPSSEPPKPKNADGVITEVKSDVIEEKEHTTDEIIAFSSSTIEDASLPQGTTRMKTAGSNGSKTKTWKVTYKNGVESSRVLESEIVTANPVNEVKVVGTMVPQPEPQRRVPVMSEPMRPLPQPAPPQPTGECDPNYTPCIPYVPGNTLNCPDIAVMVQIVGDDHNKFDADNDGVGCESYQ